MPPLGLILAGGAASRLGGGDKSLRRVGAQTILARIVARLHPQCHGLILNANGDPSRFERYGLPVVADHPADAGGGPLSGLLAGLDWVATHRPDVAFVLSAPADTPFLPHDLAARLWAARQGRTAACARSGDRPHPLAGVWPVRVRHDLRQAVRTDGLRRAAGFLERHSIGWASWPTIPIDPFLNVNTPEDLALADRLAGASDPVPPSPTVA